MPLDPLRRAGAESCDLLSLGNVRHFRRLPTSHRTRLSQTRLRTASRIFLEPLAEVSILFEDELQSLADDMIGGVRADELGVTLHRFCKRFVEPNVVFAFCNGWLWGLKQRHSNAFFRWLDLWQELPATSGRICPQVLARVASECWQALVCERRGKKRTGDS